VSPLHFDQDAVEDILGIVKFLQGRQTGLGRHFANCLNKRLELISWNPRIFGGIYFVVRASDIPVFPHVIYYRVDRHREVHIIAVRHGRENPKVWKKRYRR
jgi:plasmid stabilization system protein ParE